MGNRHLSSYFPQKAPVNRSGLKIKILKRMSIKSSKVWRKISLKNGLALQAFRIYLEFRPRLARNCRIPTKQDHRSGWGSSGKNSDAQVSIKYWRDLRFLGEETSKCEIYVLAQNARSKVVNWVSIRSVPLRWRSSSIYSCEKYGGK